MKVKFTKKTGKNSYIEIDQNILRNKIISLYKNKPYGIGRSITDPSLFSLDRINYQRFNYSDGSIEYKEM